MYCIRGSSSRPRGDDCACASQRREASVIIGIGLLTIGFFAGHSTASGWVGLLAEHGKGHAAGLYLLGYYLGSSLIGALGGLFWAHSAWAGVTAMVTVVLVAALAATLHLAGWQRRVNAG